MHGVAAHTIARQLVGCSFSFCYMSEIGGLIVDYQHIHTGIAMMKEVRME